MITEAQMQRLLKGYRKADKAAAAAFYSRPDLLKKWDCTTTPRFKMLLATCLAETAGFTVYVESGMFKSAARIKEVWPTRFATVEAAKAYVMNPRKLLNKVYGERMGNEDDGTDDDDGFNYRGRGAGQNTGKGNYRKIGKAVGQDLVNNPELLSQPAIALEAILCEAKPLWRYADMNTLEGFRKFSNGINAGNPNLDKDPIGWKDRKEWYAKVNALALDGRRTSPKEPPTVGEFLVSFGEHSPEVKRMQARLWGLGYFEVGKRDGKFGTDTQAGLLAFQAVNGLPTTPNGMDAITSAALYAETAARKPKGSKPSVGMGELIKAGSRIVNDGRDVAGAGIAIATGGVVIAQQPGAPTVVPTTITATDPGILSRAGEWMTQFELVQALATRVQASWAFIGDHYWVLLVVGGAYLAWKGWGIISARVQDAQMGITSDTSEG